MPLCVFTDETGPIAINPYLVTTVMRGQNGDVVVYLSGAGAPIHLKDNFENVVGRLDVAANTGPS